MFIIICNEIIFLVRIYFLVTHFLFLNIFFYNFKFEVKFFIGEDNSIINYHKLIKSRHILLLVRLLVFISILFLKY